MKKNYDNILLFGTVFLLFVSTAFAQNGDSRSITSDDFASQRPVGKTSNSSNRRTQNNRTKRRQTYKYVRRNTVVRRKKTTKPTNPTTANKPEKVSEIGVTMWRLRPSRTSDNGYKLPVLVNNLREMWTAERISLDSIFAAGDRVRLAIESSDSGYLYVINSETYADGTFGEPFLVFPAATNEDNSVKPGLLVDIPDQTENLPYFLINPGKESYTGELLTVIISPKPLTNLKIESNGKIKNLDNLIELEELSDAEIFSRSDTENKIYSQTEAEAACGSKSRQLEREKNTANPCGTKTRQLTREEPLPQTIYRVKTQSGQPIVAFISLNVKR